MYSVRYGGKKGKRYRFAISNQHVVVRTNSRDALHTVRDRKAAPVSPESSSILEKFELVTRFHEAGVEILRAKVARGARGLCDRARTRLKEEREVEFAGRVLIEPTAGHPVIYTKNFFIKFDSELRTGACRKLIENYGLYIKRELDYSPNAFFIAAPGDAGREIFAIAENLLREPGVELCHPELIREARRRAAFPQQWHLKATIINDHFVDQHASVEAA
ncbi:MAG: peptidase S8, partial [Blastocatellia bacterium]|nr:peptidase S8 [Blastocatellia bacterium]